jgi:tetratricopeptide (TPR) repeat protein
MFETKANIALHSAAQVKLSQTLSSLNSKFVVVDIPGWQVVLGTIKKIKTRKLNSNLKNYYYLNPTHPLKKFQSQNIEIPLLFYKNNHLSPAGHRLLALLTYNFLVKNHLVPSQSHWRTIGLSNPKTKNSIKNANRRIEQFIKTDNRLNRFRGLFDESAGDYIAAKKSLIQYLTLANKDYEAHYLLGKVLLFLNEFSSALESFKKFFGGASIDGRTIMREN